MNDLYLLWLPLRFNKGTIIENKSIDEVVSITCKIQPLVNASEISSRTHDLSVSDEKDGSKLITVKGMRAQDNHTSGSNFSLSYTVHSDKIQAFGIRKTIEKTKENHLCVFVTPPNKITQTFGRAIYFLLDRSGSMTSKPFENVIIGICYALYRLRKTDMFGLCIFDHKELYFSNDLTIASKENIKRF